MPTKHRIIGLALVGVALLTALVLYGRLPEQIPSHWNLAGEVDQTLPKPWGVLLLPSVMLVLLAVFEAIIVVSPRGFRLDRSRGVVGIVQVATLGFMLLVFAMQMWVALGHDVSVEKVIVPGVGALFIVVGNFLGKVRKNFFFGVRTPWTLASDEVWARTHRLAGQMFVLGGVVLIVAGFMGAGITVVLITTAVIALVPVVYSLVLYKRLEGLGPDED